MELRQLVRDVRANALVALAVLLVCIAAGVAFAVVPAKQYEASTTLLIEPSSGSDPASALAALQFAPQMAIEATTSTIVADARGTLPSDEASAPVTIAATGDPGTGSLVINAKGKDPAAIAALANADAKQVQHIQPSNVGYQLRQISSATPPTAPANPRKTILFAAGAFGVIAAIFAALGAAGLRRRFSRVLEVRDRIGLTVLGEIPRFGRGLTRPPELFVLGTNLAAAEAFQELRSRLLLSIADMGVTSIGITSSDPGEGKTSVAANLAWVLATEGRQVTAVDCDLREPSLHFQLGVPFGPGVAAGHISATLGELMKTTNPDLHAVPAGIPDRHPADVVAARLPLFLEALTERGHFVVVDCPPMLGNAESSLIASMVGVMLVVVDARRFNPERLELCISRLQSSGAHIVGVVLNRVRRPARRKSYGYGYGYGYRRSKKSVSPGVVSEDLPVSEVR
jgi:Mrp family chromosome partitioning ATPase/capsular polysaccharide biosynthesis protein